MNQIEQLALPFAATQGDVASFVPGAANEAALAWLARPAEWPAGRLALWGEAGTGKTHLLRIFAGTHPDALVIDEADRIADAERLLHRLNGAADAGIPTLLAARTPPHEWPVALPDLASRLRATMAVRLGAPDDALLRALLALLLAERQLDLPQPWCRALLARLPRQGAALREAVRLLDAAMLAARGRISLALVSEIADQVASGAS